MLASLAARVLSPVKPAPADPAPASAAAAVDAQSDATPTRPSLVRAASEDSALSELPEGDLDARPAAKKARVSPAPEQEQLPTPSPSRSVASSSAAATKQRFSAAAPAGRSRTTRAGIADNEVATVDENPALGRDGKAYLISGVYWSAALPARPARREEGQGAAPSSWRAVEPSKQTAFPPPAFYGETLLDEDGPVAERGFRLPFDILRDFWYTDEAAGRKGKGRAKGRVVEDAHLPVREGKGGDKTTEEDIARREKSKKPDPYRYISKNVYVGRGPDKSLLPAICACKKPARPSEMGCGQDCINRLMQYCCDPKKCPCGEQCGNPPLNKREGVPEGKDGLRVIWTGNRGFGLKTMVPIKEGEFVIEYRGEIISRDESYRRVLTDYKDRTSYYFMDYDGFEVVDAGQRGNSARFINHSCGPNLQVVRWRLATMEEWQMGLFALHDIPVGTELTYDYGWQDFASIKPTAAAVAAVAAATAASAAAEAAPADAANSAPSADAPSPAAPTVTPASATAPESAPAAPPASASLIALSTSTAIDPARQRCYCGAAECSGFLGGRKKAGPGGARKGKGKGKVEVELPEGRDEGSRPAVAFAKAKIRLEALVGAGSAKERVARRGSAAGVAERRAKEKEEKVGLLKSGRAAAKKALGKLLG